MFVLEKRLSWRQLIFRWHGAISAQIKGRVAAVVAVATLVTILHFQLNQMVHLTPLPFTLIGLALSIFLGFRNNTSYQRYWEGRILWGRMVNVSRTFARRVTTLIADDTGRLHRHLIRSQAAYVHALRIRLRSESYAPLERLIGKDETQLITRRNNPPIAILESIARKLRSAYDEGQIHALHLPLLEEALETMTDVQGGCERILSTPIPFSYTVLIHRIVAVYCFGLPFGIVESVGEFTPFVALLVSYAFLGLDTIGDAIEEPFGSEAHDLPLNALSTMIEINVRESIGDEPLPQMVQPINEILT
jgi:putative membrane protein